MTGRVFTLGVLVLACGRTDMGLLDSARTEAGGAGALGGDGGAAGSLGGDGGIAGSASGARGGASAGASAGSGNGGEAGTGPVGCALRVGALSPGDRERDVPTSTIIEANVSCADGREPKWEALTLTVSAHGRRVEGRVESDVYLGIVRFFPARSLALAATFDVVLTDTRTGAASGEWHFTTRDGHWQTPAVMKGSDQWLAVDDSDHALLFFMNSAGNEVWSTRFEAETLAWTTPARFPRRALTPVAGLDRQGGATIAWGQQDNGYPSVWAARALEGSDPMPVELRASDAPYSRFQSAAFRTDGTGLVVWSDNPTSTGYRDRLLARAFGDDSSAEPRILARETGLLAARVAVEADGGAWVIWHESNVTTNAIYVEHRAPSGVWEMTEPLATGSVGNPRVATGGGRTIFLWTESSPADHIAHLRARTFDAQSRWSDVASLDAAGDLPAPTDYSNVAYPQVAMDGRGYGLAVWTTIVQYVTSMTPSSTSYGNRSELRAQRYDFAGGWAQSHVPLGSVAESSEQRHPNEPCVAFDAYGNALVLWAEGEADARAQAARFLFESGFREPATVATAWRGSAGPRVALDAFGRGFAAWHGQQSSSTEFDLFAVRFSDD